MELVFSTITNLVTYTIQWMGDFMDAIIDTPLLLLFVCMPLVGIGIGCIKRLISL